MKIHICLGWQVLLEQKRLVYMYIYISYFIVLGLIARGIIANPIKFLYRLATNLHYSTDHINSL